MYMYMYLCICYLFVMYVLCCIFICNFSVQFTHFTKIEFNSQFNFHELNDECWNKKSFYVFLRPKTPWILDCKYVFRFHLLQIRFLRWIHYSCRYITKWKQTSNFSQLDRVYVPIRKKSINVKNPSMFS
jgi:hypothetical protein